MEKSTKKTVKAKSKAEEVKEETKEVLQSEKKNKKKTKADNDDDTINFYGSKDPFYEFCNFYPSKFKVGKIEYRTSEHYFQSQKFPQEEEYTMKIIDAKSPAIAARLGRSRKYQLRQDWLEVKDNTMSLK